MAAFIADNNLEPPPNSTIGEGSVVYYKNSHLFYKDFISGSVATREKGVEECVPNLAVTLLKNENKMGQTTTDGFGDYRFTNIPLNSGTYTIVISRGGEPLKEISYMTYKNTSPILYCESSTSPYRPFTLIFIINVFEFTKRG